MKLIVGLGNPGVKYEKTRHNAGFMVLDRIAEMNGVSISKSKFEGKHVKTRINGEEVILLKPETYMNLSGFSVRACMDFYKIPREDILIIYDDLDTPVGSIRLKTKGSAGGHNGMKSVIQAVVGEDFDRIRVGIGRDPRIKIVDYVLTRFKPEELEDLDQAVDQAAQAAIFSLNHSFEQTMNRYNQKPKKAPKKKLENPEIETYQTKQKNQTYTTKINSSPEHDSKKKVILNEEHNQAFYLDSSSLIQSSPASFSAQDLADTQAVYVSSSQENQDH